MKRFVVERSWAKNGKVLEELIKISDSKCIWCGCEVERFKVVKGKKNPKNNATVDHLIPRPFRKKDEISPKVLACERCNLKRGDIYNIFRNRIN